MNTEALERFFREAGGKIEDKEKYCQFHQNGGGKWCAATSQTSCKDCRFFDPTTPVKLDIILDHALKMEDLNDKLVKDNEKLEETIRENREEIRNLKSEIVFMTKKINKMHERVGILKYLNTEQFYKFFRSSILMKKKPTKQKREYNKISPSFSQEWDDIRFLINPNARR